MRLAPLLAFLCPLAAVAAPSTQLQLNLTGPVFVGDLSSGPPVSTNVTVGFEDGLGVYQLGLGGSYSHAHRVNGGIILPDRSHREGRRRPHRHARNLPPEATPGDGLLGKQRRDDIAFLIIQPDRPRLTPAVRFSRGASAPPPHSGCSPYGAGQPRPSEGLG